jgi:hypothetical protein
MNALKKLHAATLALTKSHPGKSRLAACVNTHLKAISPSELPQIHQTEFLALLQQFESVTPLRGETAVQATVRKMSNDEADALAARVVEFYVACLRTLVVAQHAGEPVRGGTRSGITDIEQVPLPYGRSH